MQRIPEIDYLKCIFILLMVTFHLIYIGDNYPYAKQIVYTFHMPGFLLISGYLTRSVSHWRKGMLKLKRLLLPYLWMETGYVIMSYLLPVRERLTELTPSIVLDKILLHPLGPYWYLHTLMLCLVLYYFIYKYLRMDGLTQAIVFGLALFGLQVCGVISFANGLYFLAGCILHRCGIDFRQVFRPAWIAIIPLVLLCCYPENLHRERLGGIAITFLVCCVLLWSYRYLTIRVRRLACFIGRNTLSILLFSPIFTLLSRWYQPWFTFDASGLCFLLVAVSSAVGGSIGLAWCMDRLHLSIYFMGKERSMNPYSQ